MSTNAQITDAANARAFLLAGNATFTIVSKATDTRYTFRVRTKKAEDGTPATGNEAGYWVRTLIGPDNENDYVGCGFLSISRDTPRYFPGKSRGKAQAAAFEWLARQLFERGQLPNSVEFWHEGRCGRCGRLLTVPSSIASGFGPECLGKVGFVAD